MTSTTTPAILDPHRVAQIAGEIHSAVTPFKDASAANKNAKDAAGEASTEETSVRERIMVVLADLSQSGQWTAGEIGPAAAKAAAMHSNGDPKSNVAVFIGETKRAMHPNVRSYVPAIVSVRDLLWSSETEQLAADKNHPAIMRGAFVRQYHMLTALMGEAETGNVLVTAHDVTTYAHKKIEDKRLDTKRVLKSIAKMIADLGSIYTDFAEDNLASAIQTLGDVTEKSLKGSRGNTDAASSSVAQARPAVHEIVNTPVAATVVTPAPETTDDEEYSIDSILDGHAANHLAIAA